MSCADSGVPNGMLLGREGGMVSRLHVSVPVFVVSDFTGETAESVAKAASRQFNADSVSIKRFRYVTTLEEAGKVVAQAKEENALLVCTFVNERIRVFVTGEAEKQGIACIDLFGSLLHALTSLVGKKPREEPGLSHLLDEDYFKRVKAVEFTINCDDGSNPQLLHKAELILIGVSRTCKTPLSMYLAHKGIMTANIPLVPELEAPEELFEIDPKKIVGLVISPEKLVELRTKRLMMLGLSPKDSAYTEKERVRKELDYARNLMERLRVRVVDVTMRAIEETAQEILTVVQENR